MRPKINIVILTMIVLLVQCHSSKKVMYQFPLEMSPPIKVEYVKLFDKGKILFDINCSRCHNAKTRRKEIYPDFSSEELSGYNLRVLNPLHIDELTEQTLTEEELAIIKTFLAYKKKNSKEEQAKLPIIPGAH